MTFASAFFDTEGPLGLPMKDEQARSLDRILKELPGEQRAAVRRRSAEVGLTNLSVESRADVSWITVETPDHAGDLVLASGMDDSIFQLNPIVTLNHQYDRPPAGRSSWRRQVARGELRGIKARTVYPPRPESWTGPEWPPDVAFTLIQAGLLLGKSIGFIPLQLRAPTAAEKEADARFESVRLVIEKWLLLEYACCALPMQPYALVEEVTKALSADERIKIGLPAATNQGNPGCDLPVSPPPPNASKTVVPFTTLTTLRRAALARMASPEFVEKIEIALGRSWKNAKGMV